MFGNQGRTLTRKGLANQAQEEPWLAVLFEFCTNQVTNAYWTSPGILNTVLTVIDLACVYVLVISADKV